MKVSKREVVTLAYLALAFLEIALYGLSKLAAIFLIPLALASVATAYCARFGYRRTAILALVNGIVTLVFSFSSAYAGLLLGPASMIFGFLMIAFGVGVLTLSYYALNLSASWAI